MIHCENIQSMKSGYSGAKTMRTAAYNSGLMGSKTFSTLSTAIGESRLEYCDTTLLLSDLEIGKLLYISSASKQCIQLWGGYFESLATKDVSTLTTYSKAETRRCVVAHVVAALIRASRSSKSTGDDISCRTCMKGEHGPKLCDITLRVAEEDASTHSQEAHLNGFLCCLGKCI